MKQRKIPLRRCTGCLEMLDKKELVRVVKTSGDNESATFSLDFTGKIAGRGAYVCPNINCLDLAVKKKGLERSFKCAIPAEVYEELRGALTRNGP